MRQLGVGLVSFYVFAAAVAAHATETLDCSKKSLAGEVQGLKEANRTISFTGVCAGRVSLVDFEVTNGARGIVAVDGAHVSVTGVSAHDNAGSGLVLRNASTAVLSDVSLSDNGGTGLSADNGAGVIAASSTMTGNTGSDIQMTFGPRRSPNPGLRYGHL